MLNWEIQRGKEPFAGDGAKKVAQAWGQSTYASPFAAPPILAHLAQSALARGATPIAAFGTDSDGRTAALWPLVQRPSGRIEFLQGKLCDHGTALYREDVDASELARGLVGVLESTAVRSLFLTNLPPWDATREATENALATCRWAARSLEASADPILSEDPGPDLAERLTSHVRGTSLRNYANRLSKMDGYAFEVFDDETDLKQWSEDFCDCHDWRWALTNTPSMLASPSERDDFERTLRAWAAAGILLRFAIRIGEQRVASAVVLRAGDRLIYHRITHSPAHDRTRAATVLVRNIVLWMTEREETTLDFGLGDESYKFRFANREDRLWRVYGARTPLSRILLASAIEAAIRSSDSLEGQWGRIANDWVRGTLRGQVRRARSRARQSAARLVARRAPAAWPPSDPEASRTSALLAAAGTDSEAAPECAAIPMVECLARIEAQWPLAVEDRPLFYERRQAGWIPYALREGDARAPMAWVKADAEEPERWWVRSHETAGISRSPAAAAELLAGLRALAGPRRRVFAETGVPGGFAPSVLRGAGFEPVDASES